MKRNSDNPRALATIKGGNIAPKIFGSVKFYQRNGCVYLVADIDGLPPNETGFYGFHIHEGTNCKGVEFSNSGNHYNPNGRSHPKHAGDLPPLMLCGNTAHLEVLTDRFTINNIIGRTVVIHNSYDDFKTQPSGNAGNKIACGIIEEI